MRPPLAGAGRLFDGLYFEEFGCGKWMVVRQLDGLTPGEEPIAGWLVHPDLQLTPTHASARCLQR